MTDPIADLLTRIRNAAIIKKETVKVPHSKLKVEILKVLEKYGYIKKWETYTDGQFKKIKITLKYVNDESKIRSIKRVSKCGHKVYVGNDEIPVVLNNLGISIISTSKGIMTNVEARKQKIGGEVICEIY